MASQSFAHSESIAAFIPDLECLITEAMDEWKIPDGKVDELFFHQPNGTFVARRA